MAARSRCGLTPATPIWPRSGRRVPSTAPPTMASRLPRSSLAITATFIASTAVVQPGRHSLHQSCHGPHLSIRPSLAVGTTRVIRNLYPACRPAVSPPGRSRKKIEPDRRGMLIALLCSPTSWYLHDLRRAAGDRHQIVPLPFRDLQSHVDGGGLRVEQRRFRSFAGRCRVGGAPCPPPSLEQVVLRMDLLARLDAAGTPVINPPRAIEAAVDKYLTTAKLAAAGLPVPATRACQSVSAGLEVFQHPGRGCRPETPFWRRRPRNRSPCRSGHRRAHLQLTGRAGGRALRARVRPPPG